MSTPAIVENADTPAIAEWFYRRLCSVLAANDGPVAITVPGGSTPFPVFEALAQRDLAWERLHIWPGDDRVVPENHEASNTGKIRKLFEPLGAHVATLSVMEQVPHFAIAWLGMGADGHVASLFPNTDPQVDDPQAIRRLTPDPLPPEAPFDRVTLTLPVFLDADETVFVFRGEEKRAVFDAAAAGENDLPVARLLRATEKPVTAFV